MTEDRTVNECYQYNSDTRTMVDKLEKRLAEELKEMREKLINRLPVWVTFAFSFLTLLVGALMAIAFKH